MPKHFLLIWPQNIAEVISWHQWVFPLGRYLLNQTAILVGKTLLASLTGIPQATDGACTHLSRHFSVSQRSDMDHKPQLESAVVSVNFLVWRTSHSRIPPALSVPGPFGFVSAVQCSRHMLVSLLHQFCLQLFLPAKTETSAKFRLGHSFSGSFASNTVVYLNPLFTLLR